MGLSDAERVQKIIYGLNRITRDLIPEIERSSIYPEEKERLLTKLKRLWPAFFRARGANTMMWILGSELTGDKSNGAYAPHVAFAVHVKQKNNLDSYHEERIEELKAEGNLKEVERLEKMKERWEDEDRLRNLFRMGANLKTPSWSLGAKVKVYLELWPELEFIMYGLRRYDDELTKGFRELEDEIMNLQGEAVSCFMEHESSLKSYLLHQIMDVIFPRRTEDPLCTYIIEAYPYHNMRSAEEYDQKLLLDMWKSFQFKNHVPLAERTIAFLELIKGKMYKHDIDNFLKRVVTWNFKDRDAVMAKLTATCNEAIKTATASKEQREIDDSIRYRRDRYCWLTEHSGHEETYTSYKEISKLVEEEQKPFVAATTKKKSIKRKKK